MPSSSVLLHNAERAAADLSQRLKRQIKLAKPNLPETDKNWNRHRYITLDGKAVSPMLPPMALQHFLLGLHAGLDAKRVH